ncbi:hypothetical protein ACFP1Z_09760 [Streptomyces gamaensis]|uniref:DUF2007 domain-containing protein n=1 Tax=Streptomyces gamaensis TaxID=1763542 RepID=A0ABW0Z0H5_9ACTN
MRGWTASIRSLALRRCRRPYPYGLLMPVASVATAAAAAEIREFLDTCGIRSTTAPCSRRRREPAARRRWRFQVLVFVEDVSRARRLVNEWTSPAGTR